MFQAVSKLKLKEGASMQEVTIIGVGVAKNVFYLHEETADSVVSGRHSRNALN